jgi:hypothetical protein
VPTSDYDSVPYIRSDFVQSVWLYPRNTIQFALSILFQGEFVAEAFNQLRFWQYGVKPARWYVPMKHLQPPSEISLRDPIQQVLLGWGSLKRGKIGHRHHEKSG